MSRAEIKSGVVNGALYAVSVGIRSPSRLVSRVRVVGAMAVAHVVAGAAKYAAESPRRSGRYDAWLDGRMWELHAGDFPWFPAGPYRLRRGRRGLVSRARERGLIVHVSVLVDGALVIQAAPEKKARARRALKGKRDAEVPQPQD